LKILLILIAVSVFLFAGFSAAFASTEPWTYEAATFNPVGVKYLGGVTNGQEISSKTPAVWAAPAKDELLKELGR
jgi:hypothetical protein